MGSFHLFTCYTLKWFVFYKSMHYFYSFLKKEKKKNNKISNTYLVKTGSVLGEFPSKFLEAQMAVFSTHK